MSTITDKLWGIYRESRDAGLDVSLTVSICNGAETFVFKSVPSNCVADMRNHGRRKHGRGRGRGRRGGRAQRAARSAGAAQLAAAARVDYSEAAQYQFTGHGHSLAIVSQLVTL